MKVGIIGGGGIVGASAGFALQLGGIVHEIVIVDVNADLADGQALDMMARGTGDRRPGDHRRWLRGPSRCRPDLASPLACGASLMKAGWP